MTIPHVCIRVKNLEKSIKYYRGLGFDVGNPIYAQSISSMIAFAMKKGYPTIELLETGEENAGIDHITIGAYDIDQSKLNIIEENDILELGVKTKLFFGPNGEKLEIFEYADKS